MLVACGWWHQAVQVPDMSQHTLTPEQVRHVAKLARLSVTDAQVAKFSTQLTSILSYVAKLSEVNVEGVEPLAHPIPLHNVLREDVALPSLSVEVALANAPSKDEPFFKVPKVIGGDEDSAG